MRSMTKILLLAALLVFAQATGGWAQIASYSQDFEALVQADTSALTNEGWLVFANVFDPGWGYLYGYGPFGAPNDGAAFCAIVTGEGGPNQGAQQLVVFSDYNNTDHGAGNWIESNTFREQTVGAGDVGKTAVFTFDAKMGNLELNSTAAAFIKTLDPNNGWAMTNYLTQDTTAIPATWGSYSIRLTIDAGLVGQIIQFGFTSIATNYEGSGVFYDNVGWGAYSEVTLSGLVSHSSPRLDGVNADIEAFDFEGGTLFGSTTTDAAGNYSLTLPGSGTYHVVASHGHTLAAATTPDTSAGGPIALPDVTLVVGDVTGDATINITDITTVAASFGGPDPAVDVNGDGTVNVTDITVVAAGFGQSGPTVW